jgi:murein DD-endopeptidase MepM/ murein hydrolase activator NlpD
VQGRGRFVILSHKDGALTSRYIHLHAIEEHLRPGVEVRGGEVIGTVGNSGLTRSGPHLHIALTVKRRGRDRFIDPEPLLLFWRLPAPALDPRGGDGRVVATR